jgi:hypothetical protein
LTIVVTSFAERHWDLYARRFVESARRFWPAEWRLICYTEMEAPLLRGPGPSVEFSPLPESVRIFQETAPPAADGRTPQACWSRAGHDKGYDYRTDAKRFCHKPLALLDHATRLLKADADYHGTFFWLDADVLVLRPTPDGLLESCLGHDDVALSRLHRPRSYSETGFLGFRLPQAKPLFKRIARCYLDGQLFRLSQWHDSWAIDWCAKEGMARNEFQVHDLVRSNTSNIWQESPLQDYMVHLKGDLKVNHPFVNPEPLRAQYPEMFPEERRAVDDRGKFVKRS